MRTSVVPGVVALLLIGLVARGLGQVFPSVSYLLIAILLGILIGHSFDTPQTLRPGIETHTLWLEVGIVLMGARIALDNLASVGVKLLIFAVATALVTILTIELLARLVFAINEKLGSLLAAGTGICGVSAVIAVAGTIEIEEEEIAYATATVILFDALTLFVYPFVGSALNLSDFIYGVWAGLTMFSTGPVTAAGFAISKQAGQWAVVVKLIRNTLIGVVAIGYATYYARTQPATRGSSVTKYWRSLWSSFPKFVIGFIALIVVANSGAITTEQLASLRHASDWAFLLAFPGLGLSIRFDEIRETGVRPVLVVLVGLIVTSSIVLLCARVLLS